MKIPKLEFQLFSRWQYQSVKLTILSIPASPVEADEEGSLLTRKPQDKSTASLLPNLFPSFTASPHRAQLHRVVVVVELCLFCRRGAAQLAARRPKLPRPLRPTLRKRSHNKEVRLSSPPPTQFEPHHSESETGPPGGLAAVCKGPRGAGSPGAVAARPTVAKLCTLCGRNLHSHFFCS